MRGQSILYYEVTKDRGYPRVLGGNVNASEVSASALQQRVAAIHYHLYTFPGVVQLWEPRPGYSHQDVHDLEQQILELQRFFDLRWATGALPPDHVFPTAYKSFLKRSGRSDTLLQPFLQLWDEWAEVYGEARGILIDKDGQACHLESGAMWWFPERYYADVLVGAAAVPDTWWDRDALTRLRELVSACEAKTWDIEQTRTLASALHYACRTTVTDGAQWARLRVQACHGHLGPEAADDLLAQPLWPHKKRQNRRTERRGTEDPLAEFVATTRALQDNPPALERYHKQRRGDHYDYYPVPLTVVCGWFGLCCLELARDIEQRLSPSRCPRCNALTWLKARQHRDRRCDSCQQASKRASGQQRSQRYRDKRKARDAET